MSNVGHFTGLRGILEKEKQRESKVLVVMVNQFNYRSF